ASLAHRLHGRRESVLRRPVAVAFRRLRLRFVTDLDRIFLGLLEERFFLSSGLELVPLFESALPCQQIFEFGVSPSLAEVSLDFVNGVWQTLADECKDQSPAEVEVVLVWYANVFSSVVHIFRQFVHVNIFGMQVDTTRLPAQEGIVFVWLPRAGEQKRIKKVVETHGHGKPCNFAYARAQSLRACHCGRACPMNIDLAQ